MEMGWGMARGSKLLAGAHTYLPLTNGMTSAWIIKWSGRCTSSSLLRYDTAMTFCPQRELSRFCPQ